MKHLLYIVIYVCFVCSCTVNWTNINKVVFFESTPLNQRLTAFDCNSEFIYTDPENKGRKGIARNIIAVS